MSVKEIRCWENTTAESMCTEYYDIELRVNIAVENPHTVVVVDVAKKVLDCRLLLLFVSFVVWLDAYHKNSFVLNQATASDKSLAVVIDLHIDCVPSVQRL